MTSRTRQANLSNPASPARGPHPVALALASAFLLWFAFPPTGWAWLAWVALAPLCLLVRSERGRFTVYAAAWLGGLVFWMLSTNWVRLSEPGTAWLAWLAMAGCLSLWWPAFLAGARLAVRRFKLPMMLAVPVVWVALEYFRAFFLTGFPWYYLGHTQYQYLPVIQIADFSGTLGLSFLMAMANACWAELWAHTFLVPARGRLRPERGQVVGLIVLAVLVGGTLAYGAFRLRTARFRPGPRVALLQSNIKQEYKMGSDYAKILGIYRGLIESALRDAQPPDLVVWPETSFPYGYVELDPRLDQDQFLREIHTIHPEGTVDYWLRKREGVRLLHQWTDGCGAAMLVGTILYDFSRQGINRFNAAVLLQPGVAGVQTYFKLHLVPFGEYVPLIKMFPWLTIFTPYHAGDPMPSLSFGPGPRWFDLKQYHFATAICFEDTIPHVSRRFFAESPGGRQPDLLVNMSNDGWFRWSEELDMHLATSAFRAVENRVPLVRAVNTGISAFIDGNGRIYSRLPKNSQATLCDCVLLDDRTAYYPFWGDWVGQASSALALGLVLFALGRAPALWCSRRLARRRLVG